MIEEKMDIYNGYIRVESLESGDIVEEHNFPPMDSENICWLATKMAKCWLRCSTKYPHPEYDIIWGREKAISA